MSRLIDTLNAMADVIGAHADKAMVANFEAGDTFGPLDVNGVFDPVGSNASGAATNSGNLPLEFSETATEAHTINADMGPAWLPESDVGPVPIYDFLS